MGFSTKITLNDRPTSLILFLGHQVLPDTIITHIPLSHPMITLTHQKCGLLQPVQLYAKPEAATVKTLPPLPPRYSYFDVVVGLMWSYDPDSYAVGSIATGMVSHAEQVKDDDPDKMGTLVHQAGSWTRG
jgi:hypothetical protein